MKTHVFHEIKYEFKGHYYVILLRLFLDPLA